MTRRRILVATPTWVGDLIMAHTALQVVRRRFPKAEIHALAPAWSHPLLSRMREIDRCVALPMDHGELKLGAQWRLARELRQVGYDRAFVLRRSFKAALLPWLARIPVRVGSAGEFRPFLLTEERELRSETIPSAAARMAALVAESPEGWSLETIPRPRLDADAEAGRRRIEAAGEEIGPGDHGIAPPNPHPLRRGAGRGAGPGAPPTRTVAFAPGAAYGPAKQWPLEHWAELAARLVSEGARVVLLGGKGERAAADRIRAAAPQAVDLTGRTALDEVVDVMAACDAVVSNDSGLMHVAAAVDTRVVAIFGSTSPHNTPPLSDRARVVWLDLECSPCYRRECPLGHLRCLREIGPDRIHAEIGGDVT